MKEKNKMNRHDVERLAGEIISDFAWENDLEKDFYGDCYPDEFFYFENEIELIEYQEDVEQAIKGFKEKLAEMYL